MDLNNALQKHGEWKFKLRDAMEQQVQLDAAAIGKDNHCELGRWLYGEGEGKYGRLQEFHDCKKAHAEFHRCVGEIARVINTSNYDQARQMMMVGTPYTEATGNVGLAIFKLRDAIA